MNKLLNILMLCLVYIPNYAQDIAASTYLTNSNSDTAINATPYTYTNSAMSSRTIEFEAVGGLIVVPAIVDGVEQKFILDTGAPALLLNEVPTNLLENYEVVGVGGKKDIGTRKVSNFAWAGTQTTDVEVYQLNLQHIEYLTGLDLGGLIGYEALENYELYIDYSENKVILFDEKARKTFKEKKVKRVMYFTMEEHFIVVNVKVGGKMMKFALDTGAEVNLINQAAISEIKEKHYTKEQSTQISGTTTSVQEGHSYAVDRVKYGTKKLDDHKFTAMDLTFFNLIKEGRIDGFLGYPFLNQYTISINFEKKKLYIWE